jgi:hypothetical protein
MSTQFIYWWFHTAGCKGDGKKDVIKSYHSHLINDKGIRRLENPTSRVVHSDLGLLAIGFQTIKRNPTPARTHPEKVGGDEGKSDERCSHVDCLMFLQQGWFLNRATVCNLEVCLFFLWPATDIIYHKLSPPQNWKKLKRLVVHHQLSCTVQPKPSISSFYNLHDSK